MSEDHRSGLEKTAAKLKAVACIFDSTRKIIISGAMVAGIGVLSVLGVKAYNTVTDIADMPGQMVSSAKGGLKSAWDHTGGAAISFGKGLITSDDEELEVATPEIIKPVITTEAPASNVETVPVDNIEVNIAPEVEADDDGGWKMPSLCIPFVNCSKDDEIPKADAASEYDIAPEVLALAAE